MENLTKVIETASKFNVNVDTEVLGYYWYKVQLMNNIFSVIVVVFVCLIIYFIVKSICKDG